MLSITGHNVNDAYEEGLWKMRILGKDADSRNGKVKRIPGPVATTYLHPTERMLFDAQRDANPFFHIFEGIWMLAGRNDVKWISQFNSNIGQYSDDGITLSGAYGRRWREHWGRDQLTWVIDHLRKNPNSRRAVLQMYDPECDQETRYLDPKDIPCNTAVYFEIDEGSLNMTVTNRSNDMIWGAYGANAVHMSMLQEFVANALGVPVGRYVQFSNNFHIYELHFGLLEPVSHGGHCYTYAMVEQHQPLATSSYWGGDLIQFGQWIDAPFAQYDSPYVVGVLQPMYLAWLKYKDGDKEYALFAADKIADLAVRKACTQWLERRKWK